MVASALAASSRRAPVLILALPVSVSSSSREEQHPARHLVAGQPLPQEVADRRLVERRRRRAARCRRPPSRRASRAARRPSASDLDARIGASSSSISTRRDVGAAGLDDVGEPALPEEPARRVEVAAVAGAEEALRIERLVARDAEVAQHQGRALDGDLAALAARHARRPVTRIDDLQRVARQRLAVAAARAPRGGVLAGKRRGDREGLGRCRRTAAARPARSAPWDAARAGVLAST